MEKKIVVVLVLMALIVIPACKKAEKIAYPVTKKVEQVDDYFGTKVADPYRWLEDDKSAETGKWVEAQNAVTFGYLQKIPYRDKIKKRLTDIFNYPRYSSPFRVGEYYLFSKNDGLQNQAVIYIQKGLEGTPEVLIDPNQLSPDGTVRIGLIGFSGDKKYAAISRSEAGSDWSEIRVLALATKKELPDRIQWNKFSGAAWKGNGFFYSGYDKPAPGTELTAQNEYQKVFYHKLSDPQDQDTLVYEDKKHPLLYFGVGVSEDERFAFLIVSKGTSGTELYYKDLAKNNMAFEPLIQGFDFDSAAIDNVGDKFLVYTNVDAPNYKVVSIDPGKPAKENWTTVIAEKPEVLSSANTAGGRLFASYLKDANTKVYQLALDGTLIREIALPALGTASGFSGWKDDKVLFYTFTSFTFPPTIYKYDIAASASEVFRKAEVKFNPEDYEVKQVFFESKDKTKVPMFIVHKKGLALDGRAPCFLTAYGGFNISVQPAFSPADIVLLENGCVFAEPNLRGGGEYGETWHKAGMLLNKQNVFDDFIAAAEFLIKEKYTSADKLAISGGSNGGLLVGAAMAQRPDLFKVALPAVGVMDMLRYHKFTVGWGWAVEYGASDDPKYFKTLHAYSPLHNLKAGVAYPATFVTTADHDDRVVPAHSFKFIATLQEKHKGGNPVLIRIETRSGHGSSNITKAIDEITDAYAFFFFNTGLRPKYE
ncbi:MAG: prolyl oligopeptidase family serine peptidase [Candidatus Aminicenantes bacterium]|nr:prolyl oligopeptidase family serine peptidase [Candidatus Aminicenantes bacterium]